ncbi:MAG: hypothetical protein TRG1_1517 [Flavobacteriaceae bacterium FS1-H7996/R]|nr:MAG: hypothetical protein TRG1_1517 [Flavobacteriaceae bacterium FS1-H7996/R]
MPFHIFSLNVCQRPLLVVPYFFFIIPFSVDNTESQLHY